jgi:hypothetical protein
MADDKFAGLFKIKPGKPKTLYDASKLAAELLHTDPGRYAELLATLQTKGHKRLTDWDRHVRRTLAEAIKRGKEAAEAEARDAVSGDGFVRDDKGEIVSGHQGNIRLAIEKLGVTLRYDEFRGSPIIQGLPEFGPWLDDPAMVRLWLLIDEKFGFRPRQDFFNAVVADACQRGRFHPVRDYLDGLRWDGKPRLDTWLITYLGAEDTAYVKAVGAIVPIAAVRRVRKPGSKFDELMIWEGPQGQQKSSALEALSVDREWFSDSIPLNAKDKEMIEGHAGKWVCEIADLQGRSKSEIERVKATLSRGVDRARLAYARLPIEVPRQCVFIGTTNGEKYLTDLTGNRRFWPVRVTRVDIDGLRRDRDQLWAEASVRDAAGESIRLAPEHWPEAMAEQAKRLVDNSYLDALAEAIGDRDGMLFVNDAFEFLGIAPKQRTQDDRVKLGEAMKSMGFEYRNRRIGGDQRKAWVRGGSGERRRFIGSRDMSTGARVLVLRDADGQEGDHHRGNDA